jgi:hypothetical protein
MSYPSACPTATKVPAIPTACAARANVPAQGKTIEKLAKEK